MSNELALSPAPQPRASALAVMASRYDVEPTKLLDTLKATVFKGANDSQLMALVIVANEHGLNPFTKQIYAFPDKGGGIVPVVGVDGWIKIMNSAPGFDGIEFEETFEDGKPVSVMAIVHVKGRSHPVKVTEYFSECSRNTDPWRTSPRRMLRHKALIQGVRVAFGVSGFHDEDEAAIIAERPIVGVEIPAGKVGQAVSPLSGAKPAARQVEDARHPTVPLRLEPAEKITEPAVIDPSKPTATEILKTLRKKLVKVGYTEEFFVQSLVDAGKIPAPIKLELMDVDSLIAAEESLGE